MGINPENEFNLLADIFPFAFQVDENLEVIKTGKSLSKITGNIIFNPFHQHFQIQKPYLSNINFQSICSLNNNAIFLKHFESGMIFRGEVRSNLTQSTIIFLVSLWVMDIEQLKPHKITYADFAPHDPTFDFLHKAKQSEINEGELKELITKIKKQTVELKNSNEELAITKSRLQSIFNEMSNVVWSVSVPSFQMMFVTPSVERLYEIPLVEWMEDSQLWQKVIHPEDKHVISEIFDELENKGSYSVKYRILTPTGKTKWVRNNGKYIFNEDNIPIRIDGLVMDRTYQYKAKVDLDQEIKLQEALIDIASTYINLNPKEVKNTINDSLKKMGLFVSADRAYIFDYDFARKTTSNTYEWCQVGVTSEIQNLQNVPMDFFPQWVEKHQRNETFYIPDVLALNNEGYGGLRSILEPQGIKSLIAIPMIDGDELIGFVGFDSVTKHHDYTEKEQRLLYLFGQMLINIRNRQKWENNLRIQEEKYRNIIANMNLGLLEVDLNDVILYANQSFCEMSGYSSEELKGKRSSTFIRDEKHNNRIDPFHGTYEIRIRNKSGALRCWLVSESPQYNDKGILVGNIDIFLDLTEQKELELKLEEAKSMAESAAKAKELFLANMSHEIRNPINGIIGLSNLLYDTKPTREQIELLDNIKNASEMLHSLISGILDMSKIENGKLELVEKEVNLLDIVNSLIQLNRFNLDTKPVRIVNGLSELAEVRVIADPLVINQIFFNLINNAIKFTHQGSIIITGEILGNSNEIVHFSFSVEDTGIGIPLDKHDSIFEIFNQSDAETKLIYGGSGIGLSIVKRLVEAYKGKISVKSNVGIGAKFTFDLYLKRSDQQLPKEKIKIISPAEGVKILIVEDNPINQSYLKGLMKRWQIAYDVAENGLKALKYLETIKYDLILMDIRMPEMDGYETTIRLRNDKSNQNCLIPIIALTASALIDEKEKALSAGMNDHVTKPFSPEILMESLRKFQILQTVIERKEEMRQLDAGFFATYFNEDASYAMFMMEIFLNTIDEEVGKLKKMLEDENWEAFINIAHKIKPNFDMVGLSNISKIMVDFESIDVNQLNHERIFKEFNDFEHTFINGKQLVSDQLQEFKKS